MNQTELVWGADLKSVEGSLEVDFTKILKTHPDIASALERGEVKAVPPEAARWVVSRDTYKLIDYVQAREQHESAGTKPCRVWALGIRDSARARNPAGSLMRLFEKSHQLNVPFDMPSEEELRARFAGKSFAWQKMEKFLDLPPCFHDVLRDFVHLEPVDVKRQTLGGALPLLFRLHIHTGPTLREIHGSAISDWGGITSMGWVGPFVKHLFGIEGDRVKVALFYKSSSGFSLAILVHECSRTGKI